MDSQRISPPSHFSKLPLFVFVLCLCQPFMDVVSYWVDELQINNAITLGMRFLMLGVVVAAGYYVSRRRRIYWIGAGILGFVTIGHILAQFQTGYDSIVGDLGNLLRIYQLPIFTICFISFLRANSDVLPAFRKGIFWNVLIIALVELVSVVTGTNPPTYPHSGFGIRGWFYFANCQSAILAAAVPISLSWAIERYQKRPVLFTSIVIVNLAVLYGLGTRLTYLGLFAAGIGLVITLLFIDRKQKRTILILLVVSVLFLGALPFSPMYHNQMAVAQNAQFKQADINHLVQEEEVKLEKEEKLEEEEAEKQNPEKPEKEDTETSDKKLNKPNTNPYKDNPKLAPLVGAYENYLGGLVHKFGLERVAELYDYSTSVSDLSNVRKLRINYCTLLMQDSPVSSLLFGLELEDLTWEGYIYDVENDLFGVFFQCGAVGVLLMIVFLAWFPVKIVISLIRDWKRYFTLQSASFGIGFLTCLTHVWATAGVLRRPNASIYFSIILAVIFYLTQSETKEP